MNYLPPKIIAEIGCNHKGEFDIAIELLDLAKQCGADALIENIIKKNNISVLNPIGTPEMYMDNLVDADVFLGTRLHSNILVYNCGVPIIGLAYHDKINSFFDYVGMSDFKESIFELSSKKLIEDIEFVLSNRQTVFIKMNTNRKKLIELAQQTFYELEKVIN